MPSIPLRLVRLVPDPLGLFIRAGRNDQKDLQTFISSGAAAFSGVVFEAKRVANQQELLSLVIERGLDAVLDPQTQAMATLGGYTPNMANLPWSKKRQHTIDDFATELQRRQMADELAQFAVRFGFTQIISPSHLVSDADDPWMKIDIDLANMVRAALDKHGATHVQVNYSLAVSYEVFRTETKRVAVVEQLRRATADALWLNISGTGSDSSPTAITRYSEAASDFHILDVPIVADHAGGLMGLSLMAFGAVGGLSHGITLGERFDTNSWLKKPDGTPFSAKTRVYIPQIDLMLSRVDTEKLFEAGNGRARTAFGCKDTNCCHRGIDDMLQAPARHFLYQRTHQVSGLGQVPESIRPSQFLEEHVRPASDIALKATKIVLPEDLTKKFAKQSKRLNDLRITLGPYATKRREVRSFARHPITRVARSENR